ncbi:MAG: murein biosynthesis integral membrane protein MurJ [Candidatus Hydrogenedentales bacterium]
MKDSPRPRHSRFAAIFAGGTMASRLLGLVRDFTWTLLPVVSRDAFIVAFRFPNMLRDLIGEGAANAAFVPVFSATEQESDESFKKLVASAFGAMLLLLIVLTAGGMIVLPWLIRGGMRALNPVTETAPRPEAVVDLMVSLSLWTFPYLFFIGLAVFMMGPLFTKGRYGPPGWAPVLLNIAFIAATLLFYRSFSEPAYALVVGVWLGGVAQLLYLYVAMARTTGVWLPSFDLRHPGLRTISLLIFPVILGQAAGEINKYVDTIFAATLPRGAVNALFYGNRLVQLPLAIFATATAVSILPSLSQAGARADWNEGRTLLRHGLRQSFFLVVPALLGLCVLAEPIVRLLFEYNANGPAETEQMAAAAQYYGAGLLFFAWVRIGANAYYALQETRTPVLIASASMLLNVALNFAFVGPLGFRGLALATTLAYGVNCTALLILLHRRYGGIFDARTATALAKMAVAAAGMAVVAWYTASLIAPLVSEVTVLGRLAVAGGGIAAGMVSYALLAGLLQLPELHGIWRLVRRRR